MTRISLVIRVLTGLSLAVFATSSHAPTRRAISTAQRNMGASVTEPSLNFLPTVKGAGTNLFSTASQDGGSVGSGIVFEKRPETRQRQFSTLDFD